MGNFDDALDALTQNAAIGLSSLRDYQAEIEKAAAALAEMKLQQIEREVALKQKPLTEREFATVSSALHNWHHRLNR